MIVLVSFAAQAHVDPVMPGRLLSDKELSEVHAAGLPDAAVQRMDSGLPLAGMELPMPVQHDNAAALDRQQSLAQARLAAATMQGSLGTMQAASLPALFTPLAPLMLPTLAMPFPFFMAPPPKKPDRGH